MSGKKVLPDVPAMWYGNPSPVCYIGAVMRLMAYIGDPVDQDEAFALSGAGLCFPWRFDSCCDEVSVIPEIPARTFEAFGYESERLTGDAMRDKQACFEKVRRSIDSGRPVIGFGVTAKAPMACLIVGYDDAGLYTRAFWPPDGAQRDAEAYFYTADWHENCSGLLIVGAKTGERLTGAAAYARVADWALKYRCYRRSVHAGGQDIYINQHAYGAIIEWLLDDARWQGADLGSNEQFLKQCGLLLVQYYRNNLYAYLKRLDTQHPNVVNPPALAALERIVKAIPGAHASDLWLHEVVAPELSDFAAMRGRALREKVAAYVQMLHEYDNSVQWTLFMPDFVRNQTKGFKVERFEYLAFPAMRFVGAEGEAYADAGRRVAVMRTLDAMREHKSGFDYDILFMHHYGLSADHPWHGVWGRFMKADAPVPDGFLSFDFVPYEVPVAGPPYCARFAFAVFSGDTDAMHAREGFDSDAMYDVTRNIILGDGVGIPYPEKYWTAEVFMEGCDKPGAGYLFSVVEERTRDDKP